MFTVGVTTVRRWMVESLNPRYDSYVVGRDGTLFKLYRLIVIRGGIVARIGRSDYLGGMPHTGPIATLDTPIYLSDVEIEGRKPEELNLNVAADTSCKAWMARSVEVGLTPVDANAAAPICCG